MNVTKQAVLKRVNRKLTKESQALGIWRSAGYQSGVNWEAGDLYRMDFIRGIMMDVRVDLESLAREIGVLQPAESIA